MRSLVLLCCAFPVTALAEDALTLSEAQRLADRAYPTAGIARARLEKAEAARSGAWSALFPSLTAAGTYTRRGTQTTRVVQGVPVAQIQDALRADIGIDLTVFDARALAALSASGSNLDAQALESEELRRGLSFSVSAAFYGVLSAESLIGAATRRREAAETTVAEARARAEAGLASKHDLTRTELELAVARQEESAAKAAGARARNALRAWVGGAADRALAEPGPIELPMSTPEVLTERALGERGDLKALAARVDQLDTLSDEPLYRIIPTLGVRGSLILSNETQFGNPPVDGNVAATLTWRIFDGGLRYADRAQRKADLAEASLRVDEARIRIKREIEDAVIGLEEARSTLALVDARAKIAAQNAEEVRTLFSSGLAGALEQVDAAVAEFEANASASRQKVSVRVAELSLLAALGSWPGERMEP